jgi:guanylate kinase
MAESTFLVVGRIRQLVRDAFVEWAHVHGQRYGTSRKLLKSAWPGTDVILKSVFVRSISMAVSNAL